MYICEFIIYFIRALCDAFFKIFIMTHDQNIRSP